jgi:uncharacterized membrane protein YphA (DoxX/SURF4 family)
MSTKQTHGAAGGSLSQNVGLLLARVPLGAYLLLVGYQQWHGGLGRYAADHAFYLNHMMSPAVAGGLLRAVPVVELAAGAFLILGIFSRTAGLLASLALATVLVSMWDLNGRDGMPFNPLLILCGFTLYLCVAGSGALSLDRLVWGRGKRA